MKKTKILCLLLTLCLLASAIATAALTTTAEEERAPAIEAFGRQIPKAGEQAVTGPLAVPEGAKYSVEQYWEVYDEDAEEYIPFDGVFVLGGEYYGGLEVTVEEDWEGWTFADEDGDVFADLYTDGVLAYSDWILGDVGVGYFGEWQELNPIVEVVEAPVAEIGKQAVSGSATVPEGAPYAVEFTWFDEEYTVFDGVFADGETYFCVWDITFSEDWEGWAFADEYGEVYIDLYVEGSYLDSTWVAADGYGWFRDIFSFAPPVDRIDITWNTLPTPGENCYETMALPSVEGGGDWGYSWWTMEYFEPFEGDFVEDELYYLSLSIEAYNGFAEEVDILFNGKMLPEELGYWEFTDWGVDLYIPFICGREPAERLDLQLPPLAGKSAEEVPVTVAGEYTVQSMWGAQGDDGMFVPFEGTFAEGETYYLAVLLAAGLELPDATFADYAWTDITLNGDILAPEKIVETELVFTEDGRGLLILCAVEAEGATTPPQSTTSATQSATSTTQSTTSTTQSTNSTTANGAVGGEESLGTTTSNGQTSPSDSKETHAPSTGDTATVAIPLILVALFAAGITVAATARKKA